MHKRPYYLLIFCMLSGFSLYAKAILAGEVLVNQVKISNPYNFARTNEIIAIKRNALHTIDDGLFIKITQKGKEAITQLIDVDGDGKWDEILCKVSLKPKSADLLSIYTTHTEPHFEILADVRLSLKSKTEEPTAEIKDETRKRGFKQNIADPYYQMEGPGIENDKVAFRCFFDYRNGKDIYGKTTPHAILDQIGLKGSWHQKQPWGMDILKVGESLGAGALGIIENNTLYRLGDADETRYKAFTGGPLQGKLSLSFTGWDIGTAKSDGSETVSMNVGDYFYKNDVRIANIAGRKLSQGMAYFSNYPIKFKRHNQWLSSILTYGPQAEGTSTALGLAMMVPTKYLVQYKKSAATGDLGNTIYTILNYPKTGLSLYFFACWELTDHQFATAQGFEKYLDRTAQRLAYPIKTTIIK